MLRDIQRNYTRIIAVYSIIIVILGVFEIVKNGYNPETWHRLFYLCLAIIIIINWNKRNFWKPFCLWNGLIFLYLAAFGFSFPDFAKAIGLLAFNTNYTFLNIIIGLSGIAAYFTDRIKV